MRFKKNHKLEAREKILKAAERVLRLHGIDGVGIDAVMAEAGMTSGAFYNQFSSKRELLTEVLRRGFKDLNEGFQVASQGGGLREFIDTYLSEENRKILQVDVPSLRCCQSWAAPMLRPEKVYSLR